MKTFANNYSFSCFVSLPNDFSLFLIHSFVYILICVNFRNSFLAYSTIPFALGHEAISLINSSMTACSKMTCDAILNRNFYVGTSILLYCGQPLMEGFYISSTHASIMLLSWIDNSIGHTFPSTIHLPPYYDFTSALVY